MTNYRNHLILGYFFTFTALILFYLLGINLLNNLVLVISVTFIFSIIPDIDSRGSNASRLLHLTSVITLIILSLTNSITDFSKSVLVLLIGTLEFYHFFYARNDKKHRQFTHTFTFGIISSLILFVIFNSVIVFIACFLSFTSHILGDSYVSTAVKKDKKLLKKIFRK